MRARLSHYRQSPRKARLVANLVRGRTVPEALDHLRFLPKRAAEPLAKLIRSAAANAGGSKSGAGQAEDNLVLKSVRVDKGRTFKRHLPRARGASSPIRKRTSRIQVVLERKTQ